MFKRNRLGLGRIRSDEGFSVHYGHKSLYYSDERGTFEIGFEDEQLFPDSLRSTGTEIQLQDSDKTLILNRMLQALEWDGHYVKIFAS